MTFRRNGFTLVELLIALGVGALIITVLYAAMNVAQKSSASVGRKVVTQQDARTVLDIMAMEVRMASYNPVMTKNTWQVGKDGSCYGRLVINPNRKGIQTASANAIAIAMDLDNSTSIANSASDSEYIVYEYFDNEHAIKRSVSCGSFQPMLGGTGAETTVANAEAGIPLFEYFDRDGISLADASGVVPETAIPNIRRVRISIVADTKNPDSMTNKARRMTYTTDVLVKNHVLSP